MHKVLFVIPNLSTGGTNSALSNLCGQLNSNIEISIFSMVCYRDNQHSFFNHLLKPSSLSTSYYGHYEKLDLCRKAIALPSKLLRKILSFLKIDLDILINKIIAHRFHHAYDTVVAFEEGHATKFSASIASPNKLAWIHCDYSHYPNKGKELELYKCFKKIVCVSQYTGEVFRNIYPTISNRIECIYNMIDFQKVRAMSHEIVDDINFTTRHFTIVSIGRICPVKGYENIPAIANMLITLGLNFKWYILGPVSDKLYYDDIREEICKYALQDRVCFLGNKKNPYPYIKQSNLLVCLSYSEACPMIFLEAKALNIPIVTTNFPSSKEYIDANTGDISCSLSEIPTAIFSCYEYNLSSNRRGNEEVYQVKQNGQSIDRLINLFDV